MTVLIKINLSYCHSYFPFVLCQTAQVGCLLCLWYPNTCWQKSSHRGPSSGQNVQHQHSYLEGCFSRFFFSL